MNMPLIKTQVLTFAALLVFTCAMFAWGQGSGPRPIIGNTSRDNMQDFRLTTNENALAGLASQVSLLQSDINTVKVEIASIKSMALGFGACFTILQGLMVFFQVKKGKAQ